jgi:hypothetical protein
VLGVRVVRLFRDHFGKDLPGFVEPASGEQFQSVSQLGFCP